MATKKRQKKVKKADFTLPNKKMSYDEAVKAMQEDSNCTLLPKFMH